MANLDTQTRSTIAAFFPTQTAAHQAVEDLKDAGFKSSQIGFAARSSDSTGTPASSETGYAGTGTAAAANYADSSSTGLGGTTTGSVASKTAEAGRAVAGKTEGAWSKIKNFFEGGDVEPYSDEQNRSTTASREITSPTDSFGSYDTSDLHNSLSGMSVPDTHARYFGHQISQSEEGALVTVQAEGRETEAESILSRNGGDTGANAANFNYDETAAAGATGMEATTPRTGANQRIQLLGEVLRVHKNRVSDGDVRLRKEVVNENQTVQVPVSHEELVLERTPGDNMSPVQGTIGSDSEIRVPLSREVASIDKDTVVREQVSVGKRAVEEVETVASSVSHEELRVDDTTGRVTDPTRKP